jgi:copper(I)-binding protein
MTKALWPTLAPALALTLAAMGPVACSEAAPPAPNGPEAPAGISVANGRLMLPAVKGNPGAVYFDVTNAGKETMVIRAVSVAGSDTATLHQMNMDGGQASMGEIGQQLVKAGETVKFAPGGLHVMTGKLADTVAAGGKAEVTLTFVGGDKISFPAEVRKAGDER